MTSRLRTRLAAPAAALACAVLALAGCSGSSGGTSHDYRFSSFNSLGTVIAQQDRKPAQDFSGSLLGGGHVSLKQFRGHLTVVNFFASWCGPCQVESPQLAILADRVKKQGIDFLGVDTKDDRDSGSTFVKQSGVRYPVLYDQQGQTPLTLGNIPAYLPFTVLVDKTGRVAAVYHGQVSDKDLQRALDALRVET